LEFGGDDNLPGLDGADDLRSHVGHDTLAVGISKDTLQGGDGNDRYLFRFATDGTGTVFETVGSDLLSVTDSTLATLTFRWSATKLIIEKPVTQGKLVLEDFSALRPAGWRI